MKHLFPRGTPPAVVPPDADGVTWEEWQRSLPLERLMDPREKQDYDLRRELRRVETPAKQPPRLTTKRPRRT